MKTHLKTQLNRKVANNAAVLVLVTAATLILTACGGGGDSDAPPVVTPPVVTTDDAYTILVDGKASAQSDSIEPENVDTLVATSPETTEPAPVM